jgi:hypothetical protein
LGSFKEQNGRIINIRPEKQVLSVFRQALQLNSVYPILYAQSSDKIQHADIWTYFQANLVSS